MLVMVKAVDLDRAARLVEARKAAQFETAADAARALNVAAPTYFAHENGSRGISADAGATYARRFKVSFEWLMTGKRSESIPSNTSNEPNYSVVTDLATVAQNVPILGSVFGGVSGDRFAMGQAVDYARRLPGIANNKTVFALYVRGDSMFPRFADGDLIYVDPGRVSRIGDDVLIELAGEAPGDPVFAIVKRLVARSGSKITVRQFNPDQELTFPTARIQRVSRVLTTSDLAGV